MQNLKNLWSKISGTSGEDLRKAGCKLSLKPDYLGSKISKGLSNGKIEKSVMKAFAKCGLDLDLLHKCVPPCPILRIHEPYEDELEALRKDSITLQPCELMVIITSNPVLEHTDKLVFVKWDRSKQSISDYKNSFSRIQNFVKFEWDRPPVQPSNPVLDKTPSRHGASSSAPHPHPSEQDWQDSISTCTGVSQYRASVDDVNLAASEAGKQTLYYALDRDVADAVLQKAIKFVGDHAKMNMQHVQDNFDEFTPLILFCKNDTKLQEDIDHAMKRTRSGNDVMLLVVTDKKRQVLVETEATKPFGQKACLFYNQEKKKFRSPENEETIPWIGDFLKAFQIHSSLKRSNTMNRSFRKTLHGEATGSYYVPLPFVTPEESVKKAVNFFHDRLVVLEKSLTRPLVLLTVYRHDMEKKMLMFLRDHDLDRRDVHVVVLHRGVGPGHTFNIPGLTILVLYMNEFDLEVIRDNSQNKAVVRTLKQFLNQNKLPKERDGRKTTTATAHEGEGCTAASNGQPCASQPAARGDDDVFNCDLENGDTSPRGEAAPASVPLHAGSDRSSAEGSSFPSGFQLNEYHGQRQERPIAYSSVADWLTRTGEEYVDRRSTGHGGGGSEGARLPEVTHHEHKPRHYDRRGREDRQETSMDFEYSEIGRGSDLSQKSTSHRRQKHHTAPRNLGYRSEANKSEIIPPQPQSQRRRNERQRPSILTSGYQGGDTMPTPAAVKRQADEPMDELIKAMGDVSISSKGRKQDPSLSNSTVAPRKVILQPKSRRRQNRKY